MVVGLTPAVLLLPPSSGGGHHGPVREQEAELFTSPEESPTLKQLSDDIGGVS